MEIEAWFLAEHTHFAKIHPNLTVTRITDDMQNRPCPHDDLHAIYRLEGLQYRKSRTQVEQTIGVLDFGRLYLEFGEKFPDIQNLIDALDAFFA
jgi:hypothetical protein